MRHLLLLALLATTLAAATVTDLPYRDGDTPLAGRLVLPDGAGRHAAVLVVHEWWGRDAYAERRASELAALGYAALAVDMYGQPASLDFPTAVTRSKPFYQDPGLFVRRLDAALAALRARPEVDGTRIAAIGFCFGGSAVLQAARAGADLRAVVAFHPGLKTAQPAKAGAVRARVLVCHGGADPFVPPADVAGFAQEMLAAGAAWQLISHSGAVHAFTNPDAGKGVSNVPAEVPFAAAVGYQAAAERAALAAMRGLLTEALAAP
jgi:dienelactone hydrolase